MLIALELESPDGIFPWAFTVSWASGSIPVWETCIENQPVICKGNLLSKWWVMCIIGTWLVSVTLPVSTLTGIRCSREVGQPAQNVFPMIYIFRARTLDRFTHRTRMTPRTASKTGWFCITLQSIPFITPKGDKGKEQKIICFTSHYFISAQVPPTPRKYWELIHIERVLFPYWIMLWTYFF